MEGRGRAQAIPGGSPRASGVASPVAALALLSDGTGLELELETEAHSRLAVLARLAPHRLLRHVIASREPIDHERYFDRTCCAALFIDISGFSKMTEKLVKKNGLEGAEQLARHLNINLGRIVDRLTDCGADVIKFAGDAVLCIFPVVEGGPDLAAQTLRATQLSLECISTLERENYVVEGIRLTAHSGLGCGEATSFFAGGAQPRHLANARTEYTPIGAPMTQIASSEPAAGDGETVVSPECWRLIGHQCDGHIVIDEKTQEQNYLITAIKPEYELNLDDHASGGISDELRALSETEASMVADEITVVVPEAVRSHLTDLVPGAIPNIAEFRSVTVLFSRLKGLDYSKGQSELQKVQQIVRLVQETIYEHGGQLMRFSVDDKGAVVLGVFGLPPSNRDDPERGVLAAMKYCKEIRRNFESVEATVGITTGYCFSGLVGGVSRCEYTTHGPLVNLAARLMVASEKDALVDTATKDRCHGSSSIEFSPKPSIQVKGREEPVAIFVPRKVAKVRARVIARPTTTLPDSSPTASPRSPRGTGSGKTPRQRARQTSREKARVAPLQKMIGRQQECELIRRVFAQVKFDPEAEVASTLPPLCVLIEGEAGIGKSELCREAVHYAKGMQMDHFWTAGHTNTVNTPLRPFRCVICGLFNEEQKHTRMLRTGHSSALLGSADGEQMSERFLKDQAYSQLAAIFSSSDCPEELRKHSAMFYSFVTALPSESDDMDFHAPTMVKLIVYWLAERCTHQGPTLLVLDDAHLLDPTSWALCEALAASEKCRGKLVLLFASRPIAEHSELSKRTSFLRRSSCNHLQLQPMTKSDLVEIVKKRLQSDAIEFSSSAVLAPNATATVKPDAMAASTAVDQVHKLETNGAIKQYMQQFDECCVHVGDLGSGKEDDEQLEAFFSQFGTVYGATVRVREGTNRSWGLVSFASQEQAIAVINSESPILKTITRRNVLRKKVLQSTGNLLPVYKIQLQTVQLRLQRELLQTEAEKLTAGSAATVLSKHDIQHLLSIVGVQMNDIDLTSLMRQIGDVTAVKIAEFHDWWKANGFELTQTRCSVPPEIFDAIREHPSGNPLRILLLARELMASDQALAEGVPQAPGSPRLPRSHTADDGSILHTDEDTAAAIGRLLRRLTPDEQRVLKLVAVCGADCSLRIAQSMQHELDEMQSVNSKHVIEDHNIAPTFNRLIERQFLIYPSSQSVVLDTVTGDRVNHLLFAEKIVEEVVLASLQGDERHALALASVQRFLLKPELHLEQLAWGYAQTENGTEDAAHHLCSAGRLAIKMQADCEAANLCSEIIELPAMHEATNESSRIRWMVRLVASKLRSSRDNAEMAAALLPTVEALRLCEMKIPFDAEEATATTSLLLRGGQVAMPAPKASPNVTGPSAGKLKFRRMARKATQKRTGQFKQTAEAVVVRKKAEKAAELFHEPTALPRWMMLTELHLLLATSAQAAGMWELRNYAIVASLRLLEARGRTLSVGREAANMGTLALTNVKFDSGLAGSQFRVTQLTGDLYQNGAEAALAARVHSAVAASAWQLGVPEWAHRQRELAQGAHDAVTARTESGAGGTAKPDGELRRELLEAEWETHRNLAQCHLASASLDDGLEAIIASSRYSHTLGVEECRKEEALHAASWLVFWASGPAQAHEWFCGDELAASAERRADDLMLARILCGQALCEMHMLGSNQTATSGAMQDAGTSISECLDSAEERVNAYAATAGDPDSTGSSTSSSSSGATAGVEGTARNKLHRRTVAAFSLSEQVGGAEGGDTAAVAFPAAADGDETAGNLAGAGAARVQLVDRMGLSVFIKSLRCLNMLWEAKHSSASGEALLAVLPKLQLMATQVASEVLTLVRDYEDEAVFARPEYVEGFSAVTMVLLEIAEVRAKSGQEAIAQSLQLTAFHCTLAAEHFCRFFAGAAPLAANLRAACAVARSDTETARAAYSAAIDAVAAMKPAPAASATAAGLGGDKSTFYVLELCQAESGLAGLELAAGNSTEARERLGTAVRRLHRAGSETLAQQIERACVATRD